ncbi:MAG TPA: hypothetical protein PLK54_00205 [Ferruginibacter sp.]|nr:hypothetical protein [Ferruginibacter sp.]
MKKTRLFAPILRAGKLLVPAALFLLPLVTQGQADSAKKDTTQAAAPEVTAPAAAEAPELISPSLTFFCVQKNDNTVDLHAAMKAKVKGNFIKLPHLKLTFIQVVGDSDKELGHAITNGEGKLVFTVKDSLVPDAEGKLHFKAVFAGNKAMEAAEEVTAVKRARLEITPVKADSLLTVNVKLIDMGTGTEVPVKETEIGVFVNRSFLPLKLGSATTDENGEGTVEIPSNLPGDANGNITLLAKLDENETYGYLEASAVQKWGIPISTVVSEQPRALWSQHPPLWMLVTFIILMGVVWGHFLVIVYQLWRLRKEEPQENMKATA